MAALDGEARSMATNRTPIARNRSGHRITPEVLACYQAKDYRALHRALSLRPWQASPLPLAVTPLGVDQDRAPDDGTAFSASWPLAQTLQREIEQALRDARAGNDSHDAPDLPAN
jgi:hypothetical protein